MDDCAEPTAPIPAGIDLSDECQSAKKRKLEEPQQQEDDCEPPKQDGSTDAPAVAAADEAVGENAPSETAPTDDGERDAVESHDDEAEQEQEDGDGQSTTRDPANEYQLADLKRDICYLGHHVTRIISVLGLTKCSCEDCVQSRLNILDDYVRDSSDSHTNEPSPENEEVTNSDTAGVTGSAELGLQSGNAVNDEDDSSQKLWHSNRMIRPPAFMDDFEYDSLVPRPTNYYTPKERQAIADYVAKYGKSAASAKFNIPVSQAYYVYYRHYRRGSLGAGGAAPASTTFSRFSTACGRSSRSGRSIAAAIIKPSQPSPVAPVDDELEKKLSGYFSVIEDPNSYMMNAMVKLEEDGSGDDIKADVERRSDGSSLMGVKKRRSTRGRPKLLGEEIDSKLMTILQKIKNDAIPITTNIVACVVRKLLSTLRHGLLKEEGGEFEVRTTWLRCVMARFARYSRELE